MSEKPILLFLHGVGPGDLSDRWKETLAASLTRLDYPGLDAARAIAPKYPKALLHGSDDEFVLPGLTVGSPSAEEARAHYRDVERRTSALEVRIGRHAGGAGLVGGQAVVTGVLHAPGFFARAKNYLGDRNVRALVLQRILDRLPSTGRMVIVGHSLGSVIAADLVRRLPRGLDLVGLVTIGSPLASPDFHVDGLRRSLREPPPNLGWWVNFWNPADPVTTGRGISQCFPWVLDQCVRTGLGLNVHDAETYLANPAIADAIGYALYGSRSTDLVAVEKGLDLRLDSLETWALLALRYGYLTMTKLDGERKQRFAAALRVVQSDVHDRLVERNRLEGRPLATSIADLAVDLSSPSSVAHEPGRIHDLSKEDAVVAFTSLAVSNVIRPYEIKVSKEAQREALEDLAVEVGLGSQFGSAVIAAAEEAERRLSPDGTQWVRWVALGVGAMAIVAATGGLALAAAPGLAGAALVTSALAAFGPGGMVGGLVTAGALLSAGGGGIAVGLASPTTAAATVEALIMTQLTAAILRNRQGIDPDPATWTGLVEMEIALRREGARLRVVSDESAPSLKELKRKLEAVRRALDYLTEAGLRPVGESGAPPSRPAAEFFQRAADAFRPVDLDGDGVHDKSRAADMVEGFGSAFREAASGATNTVGSIFRRKSAKGSSRDDSEPSRPGD